MSHCLFDADGRKEEIHFDKITSRIQKLCYGLDMDYVDPVNILAIFSHIFHRYLKLQPTPRKRFYSRFYNIII